MFTVLLHVIYIKFYMELERCSGISLLLSIFVILSYYVFVRLISDHSLASIVTFWIDYTDVFHYSFLSYKSVLIIASVSIVVVVPDYAVKSVNEYLAHKR